MLLKKILLYTLIVSLVGVVSCGYQPPKEPGTKKSAAPVVSDESPLTITKSAALEPAPISSPITEQQPAKQLPDVLHEQAVHSARNGDYPSAFQKIEKALSLSAHDPRILCDYVVILAWSEHFFDAVMQYELIPASFIPPDYVLREAARSYRLTNKYDKAITTYHAYLARHPADREAVSGLMHAYFESGRTEDAKIYIEQQRMDHPWLDAYHAEILLKEGNADKAEALYRRVLRKNPRECIALEGLSRILVEKKHYQEADQLITRILTQQSDHFEALFLMARIYEEQFRYLEAFNIYNRILTAYPNSIAARNLKYRALVNLGCNSLAEEQIHASHAAVDPKIILLNNGDIAATHIAWGETVEALARLEQNESTVRLYRKHDIIDEAYYNEIMQRISQDRIAALMQKKDMPAVIAEYLKLKENETRISYWAMADTAGAYLDMRNPREAQDLYVQSLQMQGENPDPKLRISLYHALSEIGKYDESNALINEVYTAMPDRVMVRGILSDNWDKSDTAVERGWGMLMQDNLQEAQTYLEDLNSKAPRNTNIRTALAHTYMWRGWQRKSLEEFQIVRSLDQKDLAGSVGYGYTLYANDDWREARHIARTLSETNPDNQHVRELNKDLTIAGMRTFQAHAGIIHEYPGATEKNISFTLIQPIRPWRDIYIGYVRKDTSQGELNDKVRRGIAGTNWRINRDLHVLGSVSLDENGKNYGYSAGLMYNPNDFLSFSGIYDTYSLDVSLQAKVTGITAKEATVSAAYRTDETFTAEAQATQLEFSDGNKEYTYTADAYQSLFTRAYWKFKLGIEGNAVAHSRTAVPYYSPLWIYSLYLVPIIEHIWFKRHDQYLRDRLMISPGVKWQKDFSGADVWLLRYEQEYGFTEQCSLTIGASYELDNYESTDTDIWYYYTTFTIRF